MPDHQAGLSLHRWTSGLMQELFLTATPAAGEDVFTLLQKVARAIRMEEAQIVALEISGPLDFEEDVHGVLLEALGETEVPITWILPAMEQSPSAQIAGLHCWAASGVPLTPVRLHGRLVGRVIEGDSYRLCRLGDIRPSLPSEAPPVLQAREVFSLLADALHSAGFHFQDLSRTWFFNDRILEWYGDFNRERDEFYRKLALHRADLPASTSIGGRNRAGAALQAGALAVSGQVVNKAVASPLQGPAADYGSSFSRARELRWPGHRRLYISGTASIAITGETLNVGDCPAQIRRTLTVVSALLASRDMSWSDVRRAVAYLRNPADLACLQQMLAAHNLSPQPLMVSPQTICRDDLLFEIEVDALSAGGVT